jgi:ABC-2 type transport system permease protein
MLFLKKVGVIFTRDLRVNLRDFLTLYIMIVPILFGIAIQVLAPSVNDTTVSLALLADDDAERIAYFEQFAWVELFPNEAAIERRLGERDNIVAILPEGDSTVILTQGDEPESVVQFAKLLNSFEALGLNPDNTNVVMEDFGNTEPPLKRGLVNIAIMFIAVLGGMMIAINIVEEKMDNTVSAMNVAPLSRTAWVLGKSAIGMLVAVYGSVTILLITGYGNVNLGQVVVAIASIAVISIIIGFMQGLYATDQMDAAAAVKMLFLPIVAGVAAAELLDQSWQFVAYWIPFYWTYKGNDAILTNTATWGEILLYSGIVLLICFVVFRLLVGRIQAKLSAV